MDHMAGSFVVYTILSMTIVWMIMSFNKLNHEYHQVNKQYDNMIHRRMNDILIPHWTNDLFGHLLRLLN